MEQRRIAHVSHRAVNGVFHDFVRSVFAERSDRRRRLSVRRTRWLGRFAQHQATSAEQRWKDEGGTIR